MEQCSTCQELKPIDDCWCVIDAKTKERTFECKKPCHSIETTHTSNTIVEEEDEEDLPSQQEQTTGIIQSILNWFGSSNTSNGYKRMKIE